MNNKVRVLYNREHSKQGTVMIKTLTGVVNIDIDPVTGTTGTPGADKCYRGVAMKV